MLRARFTILGKKDQTPVLLVSEASSEAGESREVDEFDEMDVSSGIKLISCCSCLLFFRCSLTSREGPPVSHNHEDGPPGGGTASTSMSVG